MFHGACRDTGAQRTVIAKSQAKAHMAFIGRDAKLATSKDPGCYRLGGGCEAGGRWVDALVYLDGGLGPTRTA